LTTSSIYKAILR